MTDVPEIADLIGVDVTTRLKPLANSLLETWLRIDAAGTSDSPSGHIMRMLEEAVASGVLRAVDEQTSDGFHRIGELYEHRLVLTAGLFGELYQPSADRGFDVHKSKQHHPDDGPIYDGYFIVVAQLPTGQISYHYPLDEWHLFDIPEREHAAKWDGHDSTLAVERQRRWLAAAGTP